MMMLFAPHPAEKFRAPISGLRSLLDVPDAAAGTRARSVVTRAAVAARGCCCGHREDAKERRDDGTNLGHDEDDVGTAKEEEEEEENGNMEVKERDEARAEEEDELDGFWVSYGRRRPRRRLPPPIPSLVARGALRRTRTDDGRLVIRIVHVVRPECIRARRRGDRLVEHEDGSPVMPPLREVMTTAAREDGVRVNAARADGGDAATTPAAGEGVRDVENAVAAPAEALPAVPPTRISGMLRCSSSLHQMPSLRMVH